MSAYVNYPDGRIRTVKNLGWLLRHWHQIERLEWVTTGRGQYADMLRAGFYRTALHPDGLFRAYMRDGSIYATEYASFRVWCGFVNRPVFRGLPCTVDGITGTI